MNRQVDQAATAVGRDSREIARALVVPSADPDLPAIAALAREIGASAVVFEASDVTAVERVAREFGPALRTLVPTEFIPQPVRRTAVRAKRREGIDYDDIPASLRESAVEPGDAPYARHRSTYMRAGRPGLILRPVSTIEVVDALAFARKQTSVPMGVRSGGHGVSGRSTNDGGVIIDLGRMDAIEVLDEQSRRVRIEPGARWMDVARTLEPYGWALTSGDYGGVGVGGLATAGGLGFLARKHGLTIDHLVAAEVVLADGSVVRVSDEEHPDLFWGIRGAGANFGIVTSFEFTVDEVSKVGWATLIFDATDIAGFLQRWGAAIEAAPRELTAQVILGAPRAGRPMIAQVMAMVDAETREEIVAALQPVAAIAPMYQQNVYLTTYAAVMANASEADHNGQGEPSAHSALIPHFTPEIASAAAELIASGATYFFQVRAAGGAVSDVPESSTAYANRAANFSIASFSANRRLFDRYWEAMRPYFTGLYLSFETDRSIERLYDAFPPQTLARLRDLKAKYDPHNIFRDNFNIAPQGVLR